MLGAALLLARPGQAQLLSPTQVPPLAFVALQQQYPLATQVQWRRTQGLYQVSFSQGAGQQFARFTATGDVESTGRPLSLSALPASVRRTLVTYYPSRQVCLAARFVNARTHVITYETAICESSVSRTLVFTADGRKVRRPPLGQTEPRRGHFKRLLLLAKPPQP
ncbi:hypothetical protein [Hymenobacter lucidus]|uniref:Beta-lactamase-inhibitor-like PepSY-like domain-containing protein n=1 Tax=Hymenobacter lucidus TaxID=2880930 RepID=A0ABS8ARX1_9BACT|nr:hypothetical protein [Hymenobacter lucidus]MCB2408091.1 hypothetical protein [Hymenobacter lucidus]